MGELGRHPLKIDVQVSMLKYWLYLEKLPSNTMLSKVFQNVKKSNDKWYKNICQILSNIGFDIKNMTLPDSNSVKVFAKNIKDKIINQFKQEWKQKLPKSTKNQNLPGKLRSYDLYKNQMIFEQYLKNEPSFEKKSFYKIET